MLLILFAIFTAEVQLSIWWLVSTLQAPAAANDEHHSLGQTYISVQLIVLVLMHSRKLPLLEVSPAESLTKRNLDSSSIGLNFLYQPRSEMFLIWHSLGVAGWELTEERTKTSLNICMATLATFWGFPQFQYYDVLLSSVCVYGGKQREINETIFDTIK